MARSTQWLAAFPATATVAATPASPPIALGDPSERNGFEVLPFTLGADAFPSNAVAEASSALPRWP